ncbi:MAG: hypothetical protein Ct9H90mP6_08490 [Gammaproteobacteria bacterium]|nr:MAG: hypothetical protein Ct9H90mP6_08490 [Gammaproteobacteria bacterium]
MGFQVYGLNYVIRKIKSEDSLLIVDDVMTQACQLIRL